MNLWDTFIYQLTDFLQFTASYYLLLAGRCAFAAVIAVLLILVLRRILKKQTFLRGWLWSFMIPAFFVGKLKFFNESRIGIRAFYWWVGVCASYRWLGVVYVLGVLVMGSWIWKRNQRLRREVFKMPLTAAEGIRVRVSDMEIAPFSCGLLHPQIVLPKSMLAECSDEEISIILAHEKTHIRLGHLWLFALWQFGRAVLWFNPLMHCCFRLFSHDLEDICDRVVIQQKKISPKKYGMLLLESVKRNGQSKAFGMNAQPSFLGGIRQAAQSGGIRQAVCPGRHKKAVKQAEYKDFKCRICRIADFKTYRSVRVWILSAVCIGIIFSGVVGLQCISYPRYMEDNTIYIHKTENGQVLIQDCARLHEMISYKKCTVTIDTEPFLQMMQERFPAEEACYISMNGFQKVPGWGGGADVIYVDFQKMTPGKYTITYPEYDWITKTFLFLVRMI